LLNQSFPKREPIKADAKVIWETMRDHLPPEELLLVEDPAIAQLAAKTFTEGEIRGELKGLQETILKLTRGSFSIHVADKVKQAITPVQDSERLQEFLCQIARAADEQEIDALLARFFPSEPITPKVDPLEEFRQSILAFANTRFSPQIVSAIQQAIVPVQDIQQLSKFLHQLFATADEQAVQELLIVCFPNA
jgi:hypothetical protein